MFRSETANSLINKIHKRSLCVIYEMEVADFEDLLIKDSSWAIHENNIHTLLIEIYEGTLMQIWKSAYIFVFIWK